MKKLNIAYTCNVRKSGMDDERYSEFEDPETVASVLAALERMDANVELIDVESDIYHQLEQRKDRIDFVFNNAEGLEEQELREAIVPFFCEHLGIPCTGSSPKTFINKMDKATAKRIVAYDGVPTAKFQLMQPGDQLKLNELTFPLMVKPYSEGTSIGISQQSKVNSIAELNAAIETIYIQFKQSALVEEFLPGREYTIGLIGNYVLPILEIDFSKIPGKPQVRDPYVKSIENPFVTQLAWNDKAFGFAQIAIDAHEALEVRDYNRMDFRERDDQLYFLEANVIPGLHPTEADLTNMCRYANIAHNDMIALIVQAALSRFLIRYPNRFEGKTEKIEELTAAAVDKARVAGMITHHGRTYTFLGN